MKHQTFKHYELSEYNTSCFHISESDKTKAAQDDYK